MTSSKARIFGYCDRISVRGGDTVQFMVSAEGLERVNAQLVRMIHGDQHPDGPGSIEIDIPAEINGGLLVEEQFTQVGSFARIDDPQNRLAVNGPMTVYAYIWPTTPQLHPQALIGRWDSSCNCGYVLCIDADGHITFRVGDGNRSASVRSPIPLIPRCWYLVAASYDPSSGRIGIVQDGIISSYNSQYAPTLVDSYSARSNEVVDVRLWNDPATPFLLAGTIGTSPAGRAVVTELYNGKIDRCGIVGRVLGADELRGLSAMPGGSIAIEGSLARWDPTIGYGPAGIGDVIVDVGPYALHAVGHNRPVRGATGVNWGGRDDSYRLAPEQYGGVYFHEDALIDCCWKPTCAWMVPPALRSGCYALKLSAGDMEEYIPFFVRTMKPTAPIVVVIPITSYLAYANEQISFSSPLAEQVFGHTPILSEADFVRVDSPRFGLSAYDTHVDGAGVCFSSYHRPILNMRPKYRLAIGSAWQYPADLSIIAWLEAKGYEYEVLCDEDLHRDGMAAISSYKVVITGSHPEYCSERMLDATEQYIARGGRLIYSGANGYYWVSCYRDEEPWCMEVRKCDFGSGAWQAMAGEQYNQTEAVRGGLWRNRGRPPQKLVGVGFAMQGFDVSGAYVKLPDAKDPASSWIFRGTDGDTFGDFGLALGGAAGLELDRYDLLLGTPPKAKLLATSHARTDNYARASEEIYYSVPASHDYQCRGDIVYFTTANNGAVFSTGSIAWASALPVNNFDNSISTITKNVLDAFLCDGPLPE